MTVSIDVERRTIRAGVHDLLGEPEQRAIGLGGSGLTRLWIGSELHRKIQSELMETEPGYATEVPVALTLDIDGWSVEINGRADGVVFEGQTARRVDEIKTLHFASELHNLYADQRLDRFRRQAMLYGLMLMGGDEPPAARLILVDIISHEERDEDVTWDPDAVHAWLRQQVHRMVSAEERRLARLEELAELADQIPFPHEEMRPVQEEIGEAVADAVQHSRHLLLRAPTGCGKTAAVLHPAIRGALARGKRVFFLTAKTLQQKIACDTANRMQEGLFRSLQLRAKSKMCANTEIVCHEGFCPYAKEYGLKLVRSSLIENLLDGSEHQDPDAVFEAAKQHTVCPFEVSLDLLPFVDLIVCDYNYVFDPVIGLQALLENGALEDTVLIIDEAHNLIDRSRGYYSPQIPIDAVEKAAAYLEGRSNPVFDELGVLVNELADFVKRTVAQSLDDEGPDEGPAELDEQAISDLRIAFDGAMLGYFYYKREHKLWMANDPVAEVFFKLSHFHRVLRLGGDEFVHIAE
ncbi:MAG: hypothetical protein PVG92_07705, partial [Holophagae bacterium]